MNKPLPKVLMKLKRDAEAYLRANTIVAARRLVELIGSSDEKVALGAATAHLKLAIGEISRIANENGGSFLPALLALPVQRQEEVLDELERRAK